MKHTLILPLVWITAAVAQDNGAAPASPRVVVMGAVMGPTVKGAPYSALETMDTTQTLNDGTHINRTTQTMVYRDSEGRVRRETPDSITIWDPVANASYALDPKTQTARTMPLGMTTASATGPNGQVMRFQYRGGPGTVAPPLTPLPPLPLAGNGSIGVGFTPSDSDRSRALLKANGATEGVFVQDVAPGGPAEKAGIEGGDVITAINGKSIRDDRDLVTTVSALNPGASATVSAVRSGKPQTFQVVVADRPKAFASAAQGPSSAQADGQFFFAAGTASGSLPTLLTLPEKTMAKTESLGQQTIQGLNSEGTRMVSTIEAGEIGNDRAIQIVTERWYSRDLGTTVKMTHSDPRTGQETLELTGINRAEPNPDLFQVPANYQMVGGNQMLIGK
jgi:hypothetical protein